MGKIWILNLITFIAAFLLFQIELIIAKKFLPHYGGSYLVWGSCIVFFQAVLLLGYVFSHFVISRFGIARYRWAHLIFLLFPLLFFPGTSLVVEHINTTLPLTVNVFLELMATIGPVFFILSTISLVTQAYLSKSELPMKNNPYFLYSISNFGSFGALLSYPFVFEFYLTISQQLMIWRALYFVLIALHCVAFVSINVKTDHLKQEKNSYQIKPADSRRWLLLGGAGTVMFLSVNNIITTEIAPIPLLWIMPLCIYLLSYVLNFKKKCWCPVWIHEKIHVTLGLSVLLYFLIIQRTIPLIIELGLLLVALFILCMYCQNQLIITKPKDGRYLTVFYVIISFGSFLGGIITSWVIPLISTNFVEYFIGLTIITLTLPLKNVTENRRYTFRIAVYFIVLLVLWPIMFTKYTFWSLILITVIIWKICSVLAKDRFSFVICMAVILFMSPITEQTWSTKHTVFKKRNYYGTHWVLEKKFMHILDHGTNWVFEKKFMRVLYHGSTLHGGQAYIKGWRLKPIMYYSRTSAIGDIMDNDAFNFRRIGIIGLGVGSLAAYAQDDQEFDFYELDPDVYNIANRFFTYTRDTAGKMNYIFGDARLSLEKNNDVKYGLFVVDAFGGDSVPVHLLTIEMIANYKKLLRSQGILVMHISNRYIDLRRVIESAGQQLNAYVAYKSTKASSPFEMPSSWIALTWNESQYNKLVNDLQWGQSDEKNTGKFRYWTDEYSNVLPVIKGRALIDTITTFNFFAWK